LPAFSKKNDLVCCKARKRDGSPHNLILLNANLVAADPGRFISQDECLLRMPLAFQLKDGAHLSACKFLAMEFNDDYSSTR
jgi:hypothetical protein